MYLLKDTSNCHYKPYGLGMNALRCKMHLDQTHQPQKIKIIPQKI